MLGLFHQEGGEVGEIKFAHSSVEGEMVKKWKGGKAITPFDESFDFIGDCPKTLVDVSNGVVLVCSGDMITPDDYYICNPITNKWLSLLVPNKIEVIATSFVCNGNFDQYKVVRALWPQDYNVLCTTLTIEIFDSQMLDVPKWKEFNLTSSCPFKFNVDALGIISEKTGCVYWPVYTQQWTPNYSCDSVLVFDQKHSSLLEMIQLPEGGKRGNFQLTDFGKTNGLIVYARQNNHDIDLWVLDEDTKQWSLKYNVENAVEHFSFIEAFHPLHHHLILVRLRNRKVVWYNLESKNMEIYPTVEDHPVGVYMFLPYICTSWPPSFFLFE